MILAFISSKFEKPFLESDYPLEDSHKDFDLTGLKKSSIIKIGKLLTIEKNIIKGEIDRLSDNIQLVSTVN